MTVTAERLAEEMMGFYARKKQVPSQGRSKPVMLRDASEAWREVEALAGQYRRVVDDLLSTCLRAGVPSLPITRRSLAAASEYLNSQGMDVKLRPACWMTAIRRLPEDRPDLVDAALARPPLPVRSLNAPAGTFRAIERALEAWKAWTCLPKATSFEDRVVRTEGTAAGMVRHLLCAATSLRQCNEITDDATLEEILNESVFSAWLQLRGDGHPTSLLAAIEAFAGVRLDLFGADQTVALMKGQRANLRNGNTLPRQALPALSSMLDDPRRAELTLVALMMTAGRGELPDRVRLKLANIAAAMALAIDYALMPAEIFAAEHDDDFAFHPPIRLRKAAIGPTPMRALQGRLLRQRWLIRRELKATPTRTIMATFSGGPMSSKTCALALERTQDQFGLIACPWQRYRDFAAGRLLIADPNDLKRAADLLQVKNPALVESRYREVIPRTAATARKALAA